MELIKEHHKHLEVTYLLIPGINDEKSSFIEFINWLTLNTGTDTVLHISRYYPRYKMNNITTPENELLEFADIAFEKLKYVYLGNISHKRYKDTVCPSCGIILVERNGYYISLKEGVIQGKCPKCLTKVFISE